MKEDNIANCTAQCLGLLLIYYLQVGMDINKLSAFAGRQM